MSRNQAFQRPVAAAQELVRLFRSWAIGALAATFLILLLAVVSGFTLSRDRLILVSQQALTSGDLAFNAHRDEDFFTECSLLTMMYLRRDDVFVNAIETRFIMPTRHPCDELQALLATGRRSAVGHENVTSYVNYPFGSRFLEAVVLSVVDLRSARTIYSVVSYASVMLLFLGAWRNSRSNALRMLPVFVCLAFGFAMHRFGQNLAHAPGFFVGFIALGGFLAARERFRNSENRVLFFGCLGILIAFFDLLHGSIPVVLSLAIVFNHFFYVAPDARSAAQRSPREYCLLALRHALVVFVSFLAAYCVLTAARLLLLSRVIDGGWEHYAEGLAPRLGNEIAGRAIGVGEVVRHLWQARFQMTNGGFGPATWMLFGCLAAWIFTICSVPLAVWRSGNRAVLLADLAVVIGAAVGVLAWYRLFPQHTVIHVLFVVRSAAVPAAYGLVGATLVVRSLADERTGAIRWALFSAAVVSLAAAAYLLEGTSSVITSARLVQQPAADAVACAALGLKSDGVADGLIELSVSTTQVSPALALVGYPPRSFTASHLRLERSSPPGWWETGAGNYILGITHRPNSALINQSDGSYSIPSQRRTLWAHFCRDGHDTPDSRYMLIYAGTSLVVQQP